MMTIYYNESQYRKLGWQYAFLKLINYLRDKYDTKIIHHKGADHQNTQMLIPEFDSYINDSDLLIYNSESNSLIGLTWADNPGEIVNMFVKRDNPLDKILVLQFSNKWGKNFDKSVYKFQILQGTHYVFDPKIDYDFFYHERRFRKEILNEKFIDKMFFEGWERGILSGLRNLGICNEKINASGIGYMEELIKYKMGLGIAGVGELCSREIEYMAMGIPVIKLEYITQLNPPLIPNFHYIAIERDKYEIPWNCHLDQKGSDQIVKAFQERFFEVKDDQKLLDFITKNGREYYEKFSHPCVQISYLTSILGL